MVVSCFLYIYYYYYILQLGFHPVEVVLTLVHTIQMENYKTVHTVSTSTHIKTHKRITKTSHINKTIHSLQKHPHTIQQNTRTWYTLQTLHTENTDAHHWAKDTNESTWESYTHFTGPSLHYTYIHVTAYSVLPLFTSLHFTSLHY
jgi:hypothetical protein